jgi:hypothetical protein
MRSALVLMAMARCILAGHRSGALTERNKSRYVTTSATVRVSLQTDGIYEVGLGTDDGVRVGSKLSVLRGGKKIGQVVAIEASFDNCIVTAVPSRVSGVLASMGISGPPGISLQNQETFEYSLLPITPVDALFTLR